MAQLNPNLNPTFKESAFAGSTTSASDHAALADTAAPRESRRLTLLLAAVALVSLVGLGDAIYLSVLHFSGATARCTVLTGCSEVLGSSYASIGGVPLALVGAISYFTVFTLAVLAVFGYPRAATLLVPLVAVMCVVSLGLIFLQAFVIRQFCEFCLLSAGVTFTLAVLVALARRAAEKLNTGETG
jgi:uncharacterized membrane protein